MINQALALLLGDQIFQGKLPAIIESFVQYYGEENRTYIEERFNSLLAFCFNKPEEKNSIINKVIKSINEKYYQAFMEKFNIEYTEENVSLYLPTRLNSLSDLSLIEKYLLYKARLNKPIAEKRQEAINEALDFLNNRYKLNTTFEEFLAKKGTPEFKRFIDSLPSYSGDVIKSVISDEYVDLKEKFLRSRLIEKLQKVDPTITEDNFDELFQNGTNETILRVEAMAPEFIKMHNSFLEEISPLQPHIAYTEKCEVLKRETEEKHFIDYILKFQDYLPPEEVKELKSKISINSKINFRDFPIIYLFFDTSLSATPLIEAFSSESNKVLAENKPDWKVESIKYDRIRFFKKYGIQKGDDYETYMNDPECQKIMPSEQFVSELKANRSKSTEQALIDYYQSLPDYKLIVEQIHNANPDADHNTFDPNMYENTLMSICPNIKQTESGPVLAPLAFFRMTESNLKHLDAYIIHELNHVYELRLIEDTPDYTIYGCGWDIIKVPKNLDVEITLEKNEDKRGYELFSEIINELISQEICQILHQNGVFIFSPKEIARISNKTSYEFTIFIIRDFYNTYYEDIKESRRTGDMSKLFAKVGEENFNALNDLFAIFYQHFKNEAVLAKAKKNISEGKEDEETRAYQSIVEKRDIILAKMQEHAKEYEASHSLN